MDDQGWKRTSNFVVLIRSRNYSSFFVHRELVLNRADIRWIFTLSFSRAPSSCPTRILHVFLPHQMKREEERHLAQIKGFHYMHCLQKIPQGKVSEHDEISTCYIFPRPEICPTDHIQTWGRMSSQPCYCNELSNPLKVYDRFIDTLSKCKGG